jgi:aerobic C4-dicarboxylate transport protein
MSKGWWKNLYLQVLVAIAIGVLLGYFRPDLGAAMKPFGDGFIKLVRMIIGPVIFLTVVGGIARIGDLRHVGRIGLKALIYFEVLTTLALIIGLVVVNVLQPGAGMHIDPAQLDASGVAQYKQAAQEQGITGYLLDIIPGDFLGAFVEGKLLQVLLVALLSGIALTRMGRTGARLIAIADDLSRLFFAIVGMIMRLAPIGAFGAMAFTIGKFGLGTLASLGWLLGAVYLTCFLFVRRLAAIAQSWGWWCRRVIRSISTAPAST